MSIVRSVGLIVSIFVIAVALGLLIHPAMSLLFIALAKVIDIMWTRGAPAFRESYRETLTTHKPKRKHVLTDDGELLEIIGDEQEGKQHGLSHDTH